MELKKIAGVDVGYKPELKKEFASAAKSFLRSVSKILPLKEVKITYNPGGIAVSGEATLMGMYDENNGVYITISTPSYHGVMFRKIRHMKDYTGGSNQWFKVSDFNTHEEVADYIKRGTYGNTVSGIH